MKLPTLAVALSLAFALAPNAQNPQDKGGPDEPPEGNKPYKVGWRIRDHIELPGLDGKLVNLFEANEEKVIVLVFWSLRDPQCRKEEVKLVELQERYAGKVSFYLVASNHDEIVSGVGDPLEKIRKFQKDSKLPLKILVDEANKVADDFKALSANHAFVIDSKRFLRYAGGIDNDPKGLLKDKKIPWLQLGIDAGLASKNAEIALTRPNGRKLRRKPEEKPVKKDKL